MLRLSFSVAALLLSLASAASAQPMNDQEYCDRLSELYLRYVGGDESTGGDVSRRSADPQGRWAVTRCQAGDTAAAIPVLERILRNNRFTLPRRG